jgi:DNA-binding transcriptional ArsR family regulator
MTSLPEGEVSPREVLEWAQEQAKFLTPTQTHVLWYLCINAFRKPDNPEDAPVGQVLRGRTPMRKIRLNTGLSERAIRDALNALQNAGYIYREFRSGNGTSEILVLWTEDMDDVRTEIRAGVRDLPERFKRASRERSPRIVESSDAVIVQFPLRHEVPE